MVWVWVLLGIAVAGLVVAASYAVWLWHKAADVFGELAEVGKRLEEVLALLEQLDLDRLAPAAGTSNLGARV